MHPRNPYNVPPDFQDLAKSYPPLEKYLFRSPDGSATIAFKNADAQRALTEALLHRDFGLKLKLPEGRLCPPVPNRLNYLLWLQDVVDASRLGEGSGERIVGLDIGVGASAIYPLLGCLLCPSWSFVGTDIDDISYGSAIANVILNNLSDRVRVVKAQSGDDARVFGPLVDKEFADTQFTFTMCNPPFYASADEVAQSSEAKFYGSHSICVGADNEIITPGGEVAFVGRMVEESYEPKVRNRCRWFTSMLGKHSSVARVVWMLRERNVDNYAVAELVQGQTRRWVVAWSYMDVRLPDTFARATSSSLQSSLPLPNTLCQHFPEASTGDALWIALRRALGGVEGVSFTEVSSTSPARSGVRDLELHVEEGSPRQEVDVQGKCLRVAARANTWSRTARRRKRKREEVEGDDVGSEIKTSSSSTQREEGRPAMECTITLISAALRANSLDTSASTITQPTLTEPDTGSEATSSTGESIALSSSSPRTRPNPPSPSSPAYALECTWAKGRERELFQGFWSHVCRKVGEGLRMVSRPVDVGEGKRKRGEGNGEGWGGV